MKRGVLGEVKREGKQLNYRAFERVDAVLGQKRKWSPADSIDWSNCPLMKAYPDWIEFLSAISEERESALAEGREMHKCAAPPPALRPIVPDDVPDISSAGYMKINFDNKY